MSAEKPPPSPPAGRFQLGRVLVYSASFVIVVAGLQASASILVPVLLAIFIAILLTPPYFALQQHLSPTVALTALILGLVIAAFGLVALVGNGVNEFKANQHVYAQNLERQVSSVMGLVEKWVPGLGADGTNAPAATPGTTNAPTTNAVVTPAGSTNAPTPATKGSRKGDLVVMLKAKLKDALMENSQKLLNYAGTAAGTVGALLGNAFLIVMIAIFLLLEAASLPAKVRNLPGMNEQTLKRLTEAVSGVRGYTGIKTALSLLTGFLCWVMLAVMGVEYAILFGLLAFILNYVPNIGSLIAAVPAVLIAWLGADVDQNGIMRATIVAVGYIVINTVIGNVLEPKVLDKGLGLSASIIVITMVFWGWVLGAVGMLLSVPLTIIAKIALDASSDTQWIGAMMGSGEDEAPAEKKPDQSAA